MRQLTNILSSGDKWAQRQRKLGKTDHRPLYLEIRYPSFCTLNLRVLRWLTGLRPGIDCVLNTHMLVHTVAIREVLLTHSLAHFMSI